MSDDSRAVDYGALAIGGLIVSLLLCAGGGGAIYLFQRFQSDEPEVVAPEREAPDVPAVTPTPAGPSAPDPDQAVQRMRPRYRPGPYVDTVGLLPSGLSAIQRMAAGNRGGHTVDTPWIVAGAELRTGSAPPAPPGPGLRLGPRENTAQPLMVIPGSPTRLQIAASAGPGADGAVQGLLIEFRDYPGYFFLPAVVDSELGTIRVAGVEEAEVQFGIDSPVSPEGTPLAPDKEMEAVIRVAAVDVQGRVSPWVERELRVLPVGTGDVEVTLSMTEATDLDLYVVDPTGVVVYYGNTSAFSGGRLDLDANAGCGSNMGVNNEHVFWPRGGAPAGTYQVRVANYRSCISGRPVDYRVTVRNCGETAVFAGRFEGDGLSRTCDVDPGAQRNWCHQVVSFDVTPCTP